MTTPCLHSLRRRLTLCTFLALPLFVVTASAQHRAARVGDHPHGGDRTQPTYYVSSSTGNDHNTGITPAAPWKSVARANVALRGMQGGRVLLKGGDVFRDDYLVCANLMPNESGANPLSGPSKCSGTASSRIVLGSYGSGRAILDGADPLFSPGMRKLVWVRRNEGTWETAYEGPPVSKLYLDHPISESVPLLPVPNFTEEYSPTATYGMGDEVAGEFIHGGVHPTRGTGTRDEGTWSRLSSAGKAQSFPPTNTGPQNVAAGVPSTNEVFGIASYPGVWYGRGNRILIKLADGSDPNNHSFEGTRRPYGVLLASANGITVQGLQIEHVGKSGVLAIAVSSKASDIFSNEDNRIDSNLIFNWGDTVADALTLPSRGKHIIEGGIVVIAGPDGGGGTHLLRGDLAIGNRVGLMDGYFARNEGKGGIVFSGIDGGGPANNKVIEGNFVRTVNSQGIIYSTAGVPDHGVKNNGGRVTGNELTNNQGNLYFTATVGGMDDHNRIHDSFGEGIQTGGGSVSTSSVQQMHAFNLIYNLGNSATGGLYNGFDCNGGFPGGYWINNTIYNTYAAAMTFEDGCSGSHVYNNILDMNAPYWPQGGKLNHSNLIYFVTSSHDAGVDWNHNLFLLGSNATVARNVKFSYGTYEEFFSAWPDRNSVGGQDPRFVNPGHGDFRLLPGSPAIGAGQGGQNIGSEPRR